MDATTNLDLLVSQAMFRARTLERAANDEGPWTITVGDQVSVAERVLTPNGVQFTAWFEATDEPLALLCVRGEAISARAVDSQDAPFGLQWCITASVEVPVR